MRHRILLTDDPISEKKDLIEGLKDLVKQLIDILINQSGNFPILVSGDWGAGKTSLLKSIQGELEQEDRKDRFPVIWFEAWHYEKTDGLLPALMRRVWESTPPKFRNRKVAKKLGGSLWRSAFSAATLSIPAVLKAFGVPLLPELIKNLNPKKISDAVDSMPTAEDSEPPKDAGDELRGKLNELIDAAWSEETVPIVFIDDLDRCTPEGTVQLLDSIRMLMSTGETNELRLRFVVALDQTIAVRAISTKFEGIRDYDGNRYLEKLFPIGFHIPPPKEENSARLIQKLLTSFKILTADHKDCLVEALTYPAFANPRLMKRSINKFMLVCRQENLAGKDKLQSGGMEADKYLAKWIAASERWPQLRQLIQKRDQQYWEQLLDALTSHDEGKIPGPDAVSLMAQPGAKAWMQNESFLDEFKEFKKAELRLSDLGL